MAETGDWSRHSRYSDPGRFASLLDAVPTDIPGLSAVARNVIVHYRASGHELPAATRKDVNSRWLAAMLETDQKRHGKPLTEFREPTEQVQGCCRDHTLFCVGVLRQHGIPARSLVGFSDYSGQGYSNDHVIVEAYDARLERWVRFDPEIPEPIDGLPTPHDVPAGADAPFRTAAEVWKGCRTGSLNPNQFGTGPGSELGGMWFIHNYVLLQLAHRYGDELLLWDWWGAMSLPGGPDDATLELLDDLADQLISVGSTGPPADSNSPDVLLRERYRGDKRLHPGRSVTQYSPYGDAPITANLVEPEQAG
ncbi:transglutaminase domain-containing protein [Actinopolymorpha singaporensis]